MTMPASEDARQDRFSPRRKRDVMILVTIAALALLLLAAEAAIRLRQTLKYGTTTTFEEYFTLDARTGLRVPVASLSKGHISINSLGFRGPEIAVPKPDGIVRIAFLGASTTWCAEVSGNDHAWPHLVTNALSRSFPDVRFDYVNAGVPGYTVGSILKTLTSRVLPLEPDVIVIYEATNNLSGEMRDLAAKAGIITESAVQELSWPSRYSLMWYLVEKNLRVQNAQQTARHGGKLLEVDAHTVGDEYRNGLTRIVDTARRNAKLVVVATFSIQPRRNQTPDQQMRASASAHFYTPFLAPGTLMDAYEQYNKIAREVAREAGVLLIEGEDRIPGDAVHFTDTVHFTDAGSKAMALRVSQTLVSSSRFKQSLPAPSRQP